MAVVAKYGARWCGPCKRSNPDYLTVQEAYKDTKVTFYSVDIDEPSPDLPKFILDEIEDIKSIPYVIIKDANTGEIRRIRGWDEADLRRDLEFSLPMGKPTDYSIIKPGTIIDSDNEEDVDVELSEDEENTETSKVRGKKEKEVVKEEVVNEEVVEEEVVKEEVVDE